MAKKKKTFSSKKFNIKRNLFEQRYTRYYCFNEFNADSVPDDLQTNEIFQQKKKKLILAFQIHNEISLLVLL